MMSVVILMMMLLTISQRFKQRGSGVMWGCNFRSKLFVPLKISSLETFHWERLDPGDPHQVVKTNIVLANPIQSQCVEFPPNTVVLMEVKRLDKSQKNNE